MLESKLNFIDFVVIGFYFAAVIAAGVYAMCKNKRNTVNGYFLAGRYMIWFSVGASIFASNIGSEHFIGLAGSGAASGIAVGAFELNSCFLLQLLGWVFLPVYIASGVVTLPEYMQKRFGSERIRTYLAVLSLMLYIFTKISVNLYSGAIFIQQALHWNLYLSVMLLLLVTAITTVTGGLAAVIYTDMLHTSVMVVGACVLTVLSFIKVGGYAELYRKYPLAIATNNISHIPAYNNFTSNVMYLISNNQNDYVMKDGNDSLMYSRANSTCGVPSPHAWDMLRGPTDPDMPWPGFLLGQTPSSIWYWCADQMIVQRTLAAKSLSHAQGSTLFAGFLKVLPVFILVMPGMISRVLFTEEVACVDPDICMEVCQNRMGCSNIAFPKLVLEIMPAGLRGIMMSVMLAALVSDLASIFNSASTLFTMDIYRRFRKQAANKELMIVGRAFSCFMVLVGILWIPIIQNMQGAQLYIYIQSIAAYLSPPIAAVYLFALLWPRANEKGAFSALMVGLLIGSVRMILNFVFPDPHCDQSDDRNILIRIHYMYFALGLFVVTMLTVVLVSLLTKEPTPDQLHLTTFRTRFSEKMQNRKFLSPLKHEVDDDGDMMHDNEMENTKDNQTNVVYCGLNDDHVNGIDHLTKTDIHTNNKFNNLQNIGDVEANLNRLNDNREPLKSKPTKQHHHTSTNSQHDVNPSPLSIIKKWSQWFCGLNTSETEDESARQLRVRLEELQRLKQTRGEKIVLHIFLVILLTLTVTLFVVFSLGSDLGLLRSNQN